MLSGTEQTTPAPQTLADRQAAALAKLAPQPVAAAPVPPVPQPAEHPVVAEQPVAPPVQPAPVQATPEPAADDLSDPLQDPRYQALINKAREQRLRAEKLEADRQAVEQQKKALDLVNRAKSGDFAALKELGLKFDDIAAYEFDAAERQGKEEPVPAYVRKLEAKIQEMETRDQRRAQELQQQASQQQLAQFRQNMVSEIDADPALRGLSIMGLHDKVYERIVQHAARTQELTGEPEVLPTAKAARLVWAAEKGAALKRLEALAELDDFKPALSAKFAPKAKAPLAQPSSLLASDFGDAPVSEARPLTRAEKQAAALAIAAQR